jgi:hypothetical protein
MSLLDKLTRQVNALELDLKGRVVLTEAASGPYVVTPLLAAIGGAKVFAFSRSTRYGTVDEVFNGTISSIGKKAFRKLDITLVDELTPEIISQADIITNSGHLRPLDREKLRHAKDGAVIPLMYEAWEWRDADMDLSYVRERGFPIGATNERHPEVDVFNFLGDMALKQIFDAGTCPYRNKFVLVCNNDFGPFIARTVSSVASALGVIDLPEHRSRYEGLPIDWLGDFPNIRIPASYADAEAVIFTAYPFDRNWMGDDTVIDIRQVREGLKAPFILRYAGDVDVHALDRSGIKYFPAHVASGHMGVLPSAIGFDPIIRLQSGGLKAGEAMLTGKHLFKGIPILELI